MGKKLNSKQVVSILKKDEGNYLLNYYQGGGLFDDEGNDIGDVSEKVVENLKRADMLEFIAPVYGVGGGNAYRLRA